MGTPKFAIKTVQLGMPLGNEGRKGLRVDGIDANAKSITPGKMGPISGIYVEPKHDHGFGTFFVPETNITWMSCFPEGEDKG